MALKQIVQSLWRLNLNEPVFTVAATKSFLFSTNFQQKCFMHNIPKADNHNLQLQRVSDDLKSRRNVVVKLDLKEYTTEPLARNKTGGRDARGRVVKRSDAGGFKNPYYMIATNRRSFDKREEIIEKVHKVMLDPNRSAHIALVASGEFKRFIIATQNMKVGDLLKVSGDIPRIAVRPNEGDCYPLGALPIGTIVSNVEKYPGQGGKIAKAAGTMAILVRKVDGRCIVQMPSKREMNVDENCMATVGRVSNIDHDKRILGKAGANRWLGIRPRSGLWHRKDGRFGRKIKPIKKARLYDGETKVTATTLSCELA